MSNRSFLPVGLTVMSPAGDLVHGSLA